MFFIQEIRKNVSADPLDLRIPLLPPEIPIEFETNANYEIDEIDRRLCCDKMISKEETIQALPFLMSRFGIDKDMIMKLEKMEHNPDDNLIRSEERFMNSQAQEMENGRLNAVSGLNSAGINSENDDFSRYSISH